MKKKIIAIIVMAVSILLLLAAIAILADYKEKSKETPETQEEEVQETTLVQEDDIESDDVEKSEEMLTQALSFFVGKNDTIDEGTAFSYMKEAADLGNSDAQYFIGEMYLQGIAVQADIDMAAFYLKKAVKNNNSKAFSIYAKLCFTGYNDIENEGRKYQDFEKAKELFEITEQSGNAESALALGVIYHHGMCVLQDYNLANAYFTKALDNGNALAQEWKDKNQALVGDADKEILYDNKSVLVEKVYDNNDLNELVLEYANKISYTENYEIFYSELDNLKNTEPAASLYTVLYGKNDWLFYQNINDGNTYDDYLGIPEKYFTEEEKQLIAENLLEQRDKIKQKNAEFYVLIIPNKENIYSEYMPSYIKRFSTKSRTDDLVEYLQENTDINIIYVKDAMMENKDKHQLYYYTDTHWNMKGTYIAVSEFMKEFGRELTLEDNHFVSNPELYAGDLAVMLGRAERYKKDTVYNLKPAAIKDEDKLEKKALLIGDSFGEFLNMELKYCFKNGFSHEFIGNYNFSYTDSMKAAFGKEAVDVVIWECAERYIDRLK